MVPLQVIIDDEAFSEGSDVSPQLVLVALVSGRKVSTSQPGPEALLVAAQEAARKGAEHLVFVSLSGAISGTAQAMEAAAARAELPVTVVDSRTVALASGFAALSAAAVAREGGSADDVVAEAQRASRDSLCVFTVDSLDYLRRGGRIGPAVAAVGRALGVKPELGMVEGQVASMARHRSTATARRAMLDRLAAKAGTMRCPMMGIMTMPGDDALAQEARAALATRGDWPVVDASLSAALAAHGGPGTLAVVAVDAHPSVAASL